MFSRVLQAALKRWCGAFCLRGRTFPWPFSVGNL